MVYPGIDRDDELREALKEIGVTTDDVVRTLIRSGCRGHRDDCTSCPVGVYLTRKGWKGVLVMAVGVSARKGGELHVARLPDAVADFITRFDRGAWPELSVPVGD